MRYEAETAIRKKPCRCLGEWYGSCSCRGRPVEEVFVELEAPGIRKRLRVFGDRYRTAIGSSSPRPFLTMPLVYERAYGGTDNHDADPKKHTVWRANPVGIGFRSARPASPDILTEIPNLESASGSNADQPAGFGIVSRAWSPRLEWAGTFDQTWLDEQWPLLPRHFDPRHYQSAPKTSKPNPYKLETGFAFQTARQMARGPSTSHSRTFPFG